MKDNRSCNRSERGGALMLVLMMVILFMTIIVAILSVTRTELRSSDLYAAGVRTEQLSEIAKSVVISQIRKATEFNTETHLSWASQPGAIRRYSGAGRFFSGHKLYSDSLMDVVGDDKEADIALDVPPLDWNSDTLHYVDLNEPVVRSRSHGELHTYFPIMDPRAAFDDPKTDQKEKVDGFSFGGDIAGLLKDGEGDTWRLPMPVEWLYVLRDGSLGYLNEELKFEPSEKVSDSNPIVGRIAFWTDDECCKININTASEPTYWATPSLGDKADWGWAKSQPGTGEYQRFPGHPATTALSPVLLPGFRFSDPPYPDRQGKIRPIDLSEGRQSAAQKGKFYEWAPKLQNVGSLGGTDYVQYTAQRSRNWIGPKKTYRYKKEYDPAKARLERLYASVDEFLFDQNRREHDFRFIDYKDRRGLDTYVNVETLQRSRAFLTAHSRAPETTLFGTPRIAVWPLHEQAATDAGYRTHFDQLIARCATLGPMSESNAVSDNSYYFRRARSEDPVHDIEIDRNEALLNYLRNLTTRSVPGFGDSFERKYGEDRDQILVEMFDYIRSTNTFDPYLASEGRESEDAYKTYTAGRREIRHKGQIKEDLQDGASHFKNGHGHVVPAFSEDWDCKGFGRTLTIDEVAMLFICCADGRPNQHNRYRSLPDPWTGGAAGFTRWAGDNSADESDYAQTREESVVYSNFPPDVTFQGDLEESGEAADENPYGNDRDHPGYNRANWNYCLESKKPLPRDKKRIQGMLLLDYFNPAPGYNPVKGRFGMRVSGLRNIKINGATIYDKDEATFWRTIGTPNAHISIGHGLAGKTLGKRDPYSQAADKLPENEDNHNELVSNFLEVDRLKMNFGASGPLEIELISQQNQNGPEHVLQTIQIRFPDAVEIPSPNLVLSGKPGDRYRWREEQEPLPPLEWDPSIHGPWSKIRNFYPQARYFWSFYRKGFNRRSRGRTYDAHRGAGRDGRPEPGDFIFSKTNRDVVFSLVPWHGDYRLTAGRSEISDDPNSPYQMAGQNWEFAPIPGAPSVEGGERHFGTHMLDHKLKGHKNALGHGKLWENSRSGSANKFTENELADLSWPHPHKNTSGRSPHFPASEEATSVSRRYGDFDIGFGRVQGGSFINKPDEGNLRGTETGRNNSGDITNFNHLNRIPYFSSFGATQEMQDGFFSPNRLIPSPALMGSLPSGIKAQDPWRTLLFRPDINSIDQSGEPSQHPGAKTPPDHLLLDLFWMPVVEPYAISEPFSTAGKINLNYQILPFRYIKRKTGMYGLLKDQRIPSLPVADNPAADPTFRQLLWHDASARVWRKNFLYRPIHVKETLDAFEKKFSEDHSLFRSASQICEMHLVPHVANLPDHVKFDEGRFKDKKLDTEIRMEDFWKTYRGTPDNLRERPYANIYSRVTTQTNTWRIHYRVQLLKKFRESPPDTFDVELDSVASELRGSTLIERYIDPNAPELPDFTKDEKANLDRSYRFRVLSTRRFSL